MTAPASPKNTGVNSAGTNTYGCDDIREDLLLSIDELIPIKRQAAERSRRRVLSEIESFIRESKWQDLLDLFYPADEKLPDLCAFGLDIPVRAKLAFALGHIRRFDEAIEELKYCIQKEPDHFHYHSSLAYTAYDSLYAAKNRDILLSGKSRKDRISLAHQHFQRAQNLRPDGVTNYYRQGMLLKQIENKSKDALPLFKKAVANWEKLDDAERLDRHQEKKNYIKSLYQLAGVLLETGNPEAALEKIQQCVSEDEKSHHISLLFKYFAMGKIHYNLNNFSESRDALQFALRSKQNQPADYVYELLARTYLMMDHPNKAMDVISKVPEKVRRPYVRWTEADVCCALQDMNGAKKALKSCLEKDRRSRHITLVRLAKIAYLTGDYLQTMKLGAEADRFFRKTWGNRYDQGLFWHAAGSLRTGDYQKALEIATELKQQNPGFPKLNKLLDEIQKKQAEVSG